MLAEDTFQAINSPVTAGRQRLQACVSPIRASTRCGTPSSCSDNSQKASAQPTARHVRLCRAAIQMRFLRGRNLSTAPLRLHGLIERLQTASAIASPIRLPCSPVLHTLYNRLLRPGLPPYFRLSVPSMPRSARIRQNQHTGHTWINQASSQLKT